MIKLFAALVALVVTVGSVVQATADNIQTFDLAWSGAALGNTAVATGEITLDLSLLDNLTSGQEYLPFSSPLVQGFSMTVSAASSGNGTFTQSDFQGNGGDFYWNTAGATLNFNQQLIGQPTTGSPWGTTHDEASGDFNVFGTGAPTPSGTYYFQLTTNGGSGDTMNLTSFAPVPEPSTLALLAIGATGLLGYVWRRRGAKA